ncbi:MAG: hypothetical protein ACRDRN_10030 [Sciscionella sp.]
MPIRTNRGRAAVYRKVWGWPVRSPLHLVVSVLAVALIAALLALVAQHVNRSSASPGSNGGGQQQVVPATATATTGPPPTRQSGPTEVPTAAAPAPEALQVAEAWGKAWVHHPAGTTNAKWLAGLKPYTTDEYLPVMSTVDPANIPATKVTGPAKATHSFTSSVEVTLPTDGGALDITVIKTMSGWRVADYGKAGS